MLLTLTLLSSSRDARCWPAAAGRPSLDSRGPRPEASQLLLHSAHSSRVCSRTGQGSTGTEDGNPAWHVAIITNHCSALSHGWRTGVTGVKTQETGHSGLRCWGNLQSSSEVDTESPDIAIPDHLWMDHWESVIPSLGVTWSKLV